MSFKELFYPTRKKLAVFVFIFLTASFPLYGSWVGDVITYDQDRSPWINQLILVWSFTSILGAVFQGPLGFLAQFMPDVSEQVRNVLFIVAVLINSFLQGCVIGEVWEIKKTKEEKNYLKLYVIGVFTLFLVLIFSSVSESSNDLLLLFTGGLALILVVYFTKKFAAEIFKPIFILTILFAISLFGFALSDFEESYCWNHKNGPGSEFKDHMDCHKKFNLYQAISESYRN